MPWSKEHKTKTRRKILDAAAGALREDGISRTGVDEVMAAAGLTHGAFYAHFGSKDELVRDALGHAGEQLLETFGELLESYPPDSRFAASVAAYLSQWHAAHPEAGCPVAALGPEAARAGAGTKQALEKGIQRRVEWMKELLPAELRGAQEDEAVLGAFACMLGAIVLARSMERPEPVLAAGRRFIGRALGAR
jgi:TetR/AcrR family transcriptional repressor of nem operon